MAAAVGQGDSARAHLEDTLEVGSGICSEETVRVVTDEGPQRLEELVRMGVPFDREDSGFALPREGGHRNARTGPSYGAKRTA